MRLKIRLKMLIGPFFLTITGVTGWGSVCGVGEVVRLWAWLGHYRSSRRGAWASLCND